MTVQRNVLFFKWWFVIRSWTGERIQQITFQSLSMLTKKTLSLSKPTERKRKTYPRLYFEIAQSYAAKRQSETATTSFCCLLALFCTASVNGEAKPIPCLLG
eukprot:SAG31_NODE_26806_length_436_cov_0.902077_1_plen_101_part_10